MKKVIVLLAAWITATLYFWPHYTYYRLERAIAENQPQKIADFVDFPAFHESMRAQIAPSIPARLRDITTNEKFAALSEDLALGFLASEVEQKFTPERFGDMGRKVSSGYVSFSRFDVVTASPKDPKELTRLILLRQGLRWKLAGIELPPYKPKTAAAAAALRPQPKFEPPAPPTPTGPPGFEGLLWEARDTAIVAAYGNRLRKLDKPLDYGYRYAEHTIAEHRIGGVPLEILFQMDNKTRGLDQVLGRRMVDGLAKRLADKDVETLVSFFTANHGKPAIKTNPYVGGEERDVTYRWETKGTSIEVSHTAFNYVAGITEHLFVRYWPS